MWRRGLVVVAMLSAGCSRSVAEQPTELAVAQPQSLSVGDVASRAEQAPLVAGAAFAATNPSVPVEPTSSRMIVRTAEMTVQVRDVKRAVEQVTTATMGVDGFLGASRVWREGELDHASMTVRVPAAQLDATLAAFRSLAVRVDNETVTGEDVTRQAVDLNARLTNLRATETELRALLVTVRQRTQRAADILEVHTELSRVRGEIEQHTASLQSLTQLAAMSTISLTLVPDAIAVPLAADGWQPRGVLRDATRALVATGRIVANGLIWALVYGVPMLLLGGAVVFAARRLLTWRGSRAAAVAN